MRPSSDRALRAMQDGIVGAASFMVPAGQRAEWRREWHGELWYVRHELCESGALSGPAQREVTAFCLGSLRDALWLRRESHQAHVPEPRISGAAGQCVLRLCTVLAVCFILACLLPGVQSERDPARCQVNPGVILIQASSSPEPSRGSVGRRKAKSSAPAMSVRRASRMRCRQRKSRERCAMVVRRCFTDENSNRFG